MRYDFDPEVSLLNAHDSRCAGSSKANYATITARTLHRSDPTKNLHRYYRLISASPSPAGRSLNPQAGGATPILTRGGLMDAKTLDLANKLHAQMAFRQGRRP